MTTAAIYCRISKDAEGRGLGVDRQLDECRRLCDARGWPVVETFVDNDISAYSGKRRPEYERMVDMIGAGLVDVLVAWHNDRITRQPKELEALIDLVEQTGTKVATVEAGEYDLATPSGRMSARIVGAVARGESEHKSHRLLSKMDQLAASGAAPGGRPPYGYDRAPGTYVVNDTEAAVVRRIAQSILAGDSLLGLARKLNDEGVPTREGRPWHHSTVRAVVTNPAVAGRRVHRQKKQGGRDHAVIGVGNWPAILTPDLFDEVGQVLADPARKRRRASHSYLLTGLIRTEAGDPMIGRLDKDRLTYATRSADRVGPWVGIDAEAVEELVVEALLQRFDATALPAPEPAGDGPEDVAVLEQEMAELARLRGEGVITLAEWIAAREPLQARIDRAKATTTPAAARPDELAKPGALRRAWPNLDDDRRRAVLAAAIENITVAPAAGKGRWAKVTDRVSLDWR